MADSIVPILSTGPVQDRLKGKIAFVTGTAGGQGRAVALLFARAGATVLGADIPAAAQAHQETARLAHDEGLRFFASSLDAAEEDPVRDWIDAGVATHGRIDILYNNAGFAHFAPVEKLTHRQWTETLKFELDVIFNPTRAAWPHMVRQGGASIINVASVCGMVGTEYLDAVAHAAGKGGVISVTRQYAAEGARHNIRVNSLSPGPIVTPPIMAAMAADAGFKAAFEYWPMLGRTGRAEDVAYAALFLASDESAWVTAVNLPIDGGSVNVSGRRPVATHMTEN